MKRELILCFFLCYLVNSFPSCNSEADSTPYPQNSAPVFKNAQGGWDEAVTDLTVHRRGKAIYGGANLIPKKPAKNGAQSSLIRPASALISFTFIIGSVIIFLSH
uniref:Uncharacterized protein n=1 Tax=Kalanchoe fedtschenkoi TaxID=63787 RepID=A0A7N0V4J9_KALFE